MNVVRASAPLICNGCDESTFYYAVYRGKLYCTRCAEEVEALQAYAIRRGHRKRDRAYVATMGVLYAAIAALLLLYFLGSPATLFGQVPPHIELQRLDRPLATGSMTTEKEVLEFSKLYWGWAEVRLRNPARRPYMVSLAVHREAWDSLGGVVPGDSVHALISPQNFRLEPGEQQVVRVVVTDSVMTPEMLRLVTVFDPVTVKEEEISIASVTVGLQLRYRYVTKLEAK